MEEENNQEITVKGGTVTASNEVNTNNTVNNNTSIPEEYKPIGVWGYVGYQLLFAIPLVGFIVALVFAVGGTQNKNVKNYARAYFCWLLLAVIIGIILGLVITFLGVATFSTMSSSSLYY